MTYERFEDLPVWQEAIRLAEGVDDFTRSVGKGILTFSHRNQIEPAALSVSNNTAVGFERGTTSELFAFLYIARGSAGEVRSMLRYFERRPCLRNHTTTISGLVPVAESCSRQLRAWAEHLQHSDIRGRRHLEENSRKAFERQIRRAAVLKMINDKPPDGHPAKRKE